MKRTKHLAFAIALTFIAGLIWSAQAQVPLRIRTATVQGIEISPGIEGTEGLYGTSYVGRTTGQWPGSFFVSLNYARSGAPIGISPPEYISLFDNIAGGTWSMPIYNTLYRGAIYGQVYSGTIEWNDFSKSTATVNLELIIDGGTKNFAGVSGKGTFSGTLNRITNGKPELNGTLRFEY